MSGGGVRYARNGDVRLAYRIFGDSGPIVVWTPGWVVSNVDTIGDTDSPYAPFIEILPRSVRFVMFDRRGTGLSDPATHLLSLDERVDDLRAVVDAVGVERTVLVGSSEGGCISILFAARYPERVSFFGLYGTAARFSQDLPDFPWGFTPNEVQAQLGEIDRDWGAGALSELFHGKAANVVGVRQMFGRLQRSIASPTMTKLGWQAFMEIDVRSLLGAVRAPTLVLARQMMSWFPSKQRLRWRLPPQTRCFTRSHPVHTMGSTSSTSWPTKSLRSFSRTQAPLRMSALSRRRCSPTSSARPRS